MSENSGERAGDLQDPADPKRVESVVETHDASEEQNNQSEQPASETRVETTVTESSDSSDS
jgi:hypothetical protein